MLKEIAPYIVPLLAVVLIARRSGRAQKVRLGAMWIRPAILALITVAALLSAPMPNLLVVAAFAAAALVGAALGYLRASHLHLSIDPQTGEVTSRATMIGTILILALFAARFGARLAFPASGAPGHGHAGGEIMQWTDGMLVFMVAMFAAQTAWIWNRTRPLLAEHAARVSAAAEPPK